jgi:hypothetical protein
MLSSSFDISEFIKKVKGHCDQELIYLADQEATAAERYIYKHQGCHQKMSDAADCEGARHYVVLLKDIVLYLRHGVQTRLVRELYPGLQELAGRPC